MPHSSNHSTAASPARKWIDPKTLMAIHNLELRARHVVQGFWSGLHRSPYHGFSVEFSEYRQYTSGDDPRFLDWRLYARSDRFFIRKFEDETNLRCHLLVDLSKSMTFGSTGYAKSDYAATLAATFAQFLQGQGDAVGLLAFDQEIRDYLPARFRPGHLRHLMLALEKPAAGRSTNLEAPLHRILQLVRKRGLFILISDLLAPIETLSKNLQSMVAAGNEVALFQILDPAELDFRFEQAHRYYDMESDRDLYIDPATARTSYRAKLNQHLEAIETACRNLGIDYLRLATDEPLELGLFHFLQGRMQRGKRTVRRK